MSRFTELEKKSVHTAVNLLLMNDLTGTNCQGRDSRHRTQTNHNTITIAQLRRRKSYFGNNNIISLWY